MARPMAVCSECSTTHHFEQPVKGDRVQAYFGSQKCFRVFSWRSRRPQADEIAWFCGGVVGHRVLLNSMREDKKRELQEFRFCEPDTQCLGSGAFLDSSSYESM